MNAISELNNSHFPYAVADRFEAHLTPQGALNLLGVGLRIAPRTEALALVDAFMADSATGTPLPSLVGVMEDARFHASLATVLERKAYSLAHFEALPQRHRDGFLSYVSGRIAA